VWLNALSPFRPNFFSTALLRYEFQKPRHVEKTPPSEDGEALSEIEQNNVGPTVSMQNLNPTTQVSGTEQKWFAVYTLSRHEKRIAQHFSQRWIEHFLPLYSTQRRWKDGSKVVLELPLFPGYIFVRIGKAERARVLEVPGVLSIVGGTQRNVTPLPEHDMQALRNGLHLRRAEPHAVVKVGQRARIRSGGLAGMEGIVVREKNGLRVVVTLDLIMQSVAVEVNADDLELVGFNPVEQ
jgi:transcription antitermination factor NusG